VGTKNKFRFTGEALDPGTGLYYLRARYYDPSLPRFMRKDPLPGFVYQPRGMHPYLYAGNNPLLLRDPLGLCPDCVQSTLSANQLSPAQQYEDDMMVRGDDIIEQQITNTILDAPGVALEVAGLYFFGPVGGTVGSWVGNAVSEVLQQPTYQQSIEAFSEWAVDNTLLQTPTGRDFLQKVGEGKVTAILLSQAVYNTKQELRQLGVPPDVISLVLSGLDAE
jgi:RHS repeat-associated protein